MKINGFNTFSDYMEKSWTELLKNCTVLDVTSYWSKEYDCFVYTVDYETLTLHGCSEHYSAYRTVRFMFRNGKLYYLE